MTPINSIDGYVGLPSREKASLSNIVKVVASASRQKSNDERQATSYVVPEVPEKQWRKESESDFPLGRSLSNRATELREQNIMRRLFSQKAKSVDGSNQEYTPVSTLIAPGSSGASSPQAMPITPYKAPTIPTEDQMMYPVTTARQPPIKFTDAISRKFTFPWELCKTWEVCDGFTMTTTIPKG